ncbi:MAG: arylamine N-acetyltransferase [Micromonosporaceae bacterium]|nr:arylamine N-acetyltransferase [Micromonosporaceae bacterium]
MPFETLHRQGELDPYRAYERIVRQGRGGICFHLNGAFALLLRALGYQVSMHPAGVQSIFNPTPIGPVGTHAVLTVDALPTLDNPDGRWILDVGSGEGFTRPLPFMAGEYQQGEFCFRVSPSECGPGLWRVDYDRRHSCRGVDFSTELVEPQEFTRRYLEQIDGELSLFFRYGWVKRCDATGFDELVGCMRSRVDSRGRTSSKITTFEEFFTVLGEVFHLTLDGLTGAQRLALWQRVREAWESKSLPKEMPVPPQELVAR